MWNNNKSNVRYQTFRIIYLRVLLNWRPRVHHQFRQCLLADTIHVERVSGETPKPSGLRTRLRSIYLVRKHSETNFCVAPAARTHFEASRCETSQLLGEYPGSKSSDCLAYLETM